MAFVKLDAGILNSTIWVLRPDLEIFITSLLMAQPREFTEPVGTIKIRSLDDDDFVVPPGWYGFVEAAGPGIVNRAHVSQEIGIPALERLASPEPESRSQDFGGRRMVRVDGGYVVLNFMRYRDRDHTAAERQRRLRNRKKEARDVTRDGITVTRDVALPSRNITHSREQITESRDQKGEEVASLPFPSDEFAETWAAFKRHRSEIKKPLKPTSERMALAELSAMGEVRAVVAVRHTIARGGHPGAGPEGGRERGCARPSQHRRMNFSTRTSPSDVDAEQNLLGCCLINGPVVVSAAIAAGIRPDSFYAPQHATLFEVLVEMLSKGETITDATVLQELVRRKRLEEIGGVPGFSFISGKVPTTAIASQYIAVVAELASVRQIIRIAAELSERAYGYKGGGVGDVIGRPITDLLALSNRDGKPEDSWEETINAAVVVADEIIANQGKPLAATVSFPWRQMNEQFGPMQRGQLVILAARTSIGKSSLARPIACAAAKAGHRIYFDTLEVQPVRVALQMAATLSRVGVRQLGQTHESDQLDFKRALLNLRDAGITMSRKDRSLAQIIGRCTALAAQGKLDLAIIDHGGYIDEGGKAAPGEKVAAIGVVTKALKCMAVDLNVPVILLWQLNRGSVKDANREPILSDLKDSGSVEEDADKVIFIHRPSENPITKIPQSDVATVEECPRFFQNVIQAKGRDEGTTFMSFYFDRRIASFDPIERSQFKP